MRKMICAVVLCFGMSMMAWAQRPDLSGHWQLNVAASQMGATHVSPQYTLEWTIVQSNEAVEIQEEARHVDIVHIPLADVHRTSHYATDGAMHEPAQTGGYEQQASWKAGLLEIVDRSATSSTLDWTERRIYLSGDGRQLIVQLVSRNGWGDNEERLVFDRK